MNNLSLRQLRALKAVSETSSFGAAAERLHLSPAALSGLVKEAEIQLGVRLFDRSTRSVELSTVGAEFLPLVTRVLQDLDQAVSRITKLKEMRSGIVRFAAPESLSCTLIPRVMAVFRRQYPDVQLRFLDIPVEDVLARVKTGELDFGLAPAPLIEDPTLVCVPFLRTPIMLALLPDDPLASARRVPWSKVQDRTFITHFRRPQEWFPWLQSEMLDEASTKVLLVRRMNTALSMVQAGTGFTAVSIHVRDLAASFGLKLVGLSNLKTDRHYAVLSRQGYSLAPQVEVFRDFLVGFARKWSLEEFGVGQGRS